MTTQPQDADVVIQTEGLSKVYGRQTAVDNLSLEVKQGEIFGFLGPNGAGKTTTILMLLGLTEPSGGRVRVCGFNPVREALKVKHQVGYLPENVGFYGDLTARENLRFVARLNSVAEDEMEDHIQEALRAVGLIGEEDKRVGAYSRGMRQRLGIAEVLIKDPKLIILDEPTMGLDPEGANLIIDLVVRLNRERHITLIFSSHNLPQTQRIADRVGIMIQGKMVAVGPIASLASEKLGVGKDQYSLEEIYMRFFQIEEN